MPQYFPDFIAKTTHPIKSYSLYENRRWYKEKTSQIFNNFNNNYIDLWYGTPYYGKVNESGVLVIPNKDYLKYSAKHNLVSFDFVIQAFDEFIYFLQRATTQGKLSMRNVLGNFKVKRSFEDTENKYLNFAWSVVKSFNDYIVSNNKMVLNMESYVCEFLKYLELNPLGLFSYYSIFASYKTSVRASGLAIEFLAANHDSDVIKNRFFKNAEFYKYVQTAANFGFRINKNAPWMVIADLNSKPMQTGHTIKRINTTQTVDGYLPQNMIPNTQALFASHYNRCIAAAVVYLQEIMIYGYKEYQSNMLYLIDHNNVKYESLARYQKFNSGGGVTKRWARQLTIKSYKTPSSKYPASSVVEINDLRKLYGEKFWLTMMEKVLKKEYSVPNDKAYRSFKKKFEWNLNNAPLLFDVYTLLESFYSSTKIFGKSSRSPLWSESKKSLNPQKNNVMVPAGKEKPTISKIVTEFHTGY
jgi:hypothetical protein